MSIELKEGYIYSFYYNGSPDKIFHFVFKNKKPNVLLYETGAISYALFDVSGTCFSHIYKPNLKEIGKINSKLRIILTFGLCGFIEDNNEGTLKKAYKYFYKRGAK